MLLANSFANNKIMVCAPSNAAIDEIVYRISLNGLIGNKDDTSTSIFNDESFIDENLLRVGVIDYTPSY